MGQKLSVSQASKRTGISRRTITRAVTSDPQELFALKATGGNISKNPPWQIDAADLDDWAARRAPMAQPIGRAQDDAQSIAQPTAHPAEAELAVIRIDNAMLEERVAGLEEIIRRTDADKATLSRELDALRQELALGVLGRAVRAVKRALKE